MNFLIRLLFILLMILFFPIGIFILYHTLKWDMYMSFPNAREVTLNETCFCYLKMMALILTEEEEDGKESE